MSAAGAPAGILPAKGATVDIFGRKISWDALIVAGAGLAGVIFLYKFGQPSSGAISPMSTVGSSGGGGDTGTTGTVPSVFASSYASGINPYAGSNLGGTTGGDGGGGQPQGGGGGITTPPGGPTTVPVMNATYQVPVAQGSYMPSGNTGLTAGSIGGTAGVVPTQPSPTSGGPSIGYSQGGYVAPTPSSPPPPTTAPVPSGGGGGAFVP